jgi:hypothetical protein
VIGAYGDLYLDAIKQALASDPIRAGDYGEWSGLFDPTLDPVPVDELRRQVLELQKL